jgi:hypothetical protein
VKQARSPTEKAKLPKEAGLCSLLPWPPFNHLSKPPLPCSAWISDCSSLLSCSCCLGLCSPWTFHCSRSAAMSFWMSRALFVDVLACQHRVHATPSSAHETPAPSPANQSFTAPAATLLHSNRVPSPSLYLQVRLAWVQDGKLFGWIHKPHLDIWAILPNVSHFTAANTCVLI